MIMIVNVEPAHRHHAVPVRIGGSQQPLGVFLLRVLDDREPNLRSAAGGAGLGHCGRDPDRSKQHDGDDEPALDLPLPRCLFHPPQYIYIYIYIYQTGTTGTANQLWILPSLGTRVDCAEWGSAYAHLAHPRLFGGARFRVS